MLLKAHVAQNVRALRERDVGHEARVDEEAQPLRLHAFIHIHLRDAGPLSHRSCCPVPQLEIHAAQSTHVQQRGPREDLGSDQVDTKAVGQRQRILV